MPSAADWGGGIPYICRTAPRVQCPLSRAMPISCHFRDCKALLCPGKQRYTASMQTFTFNFFKSFSTTGLRLFVRSAAPRLIWVGFNIVWSVIYQHREYNHSRLFCNLLISWRPTFRPSASWPQPETSVGRRCHRAKVTVGACWHVSCRYSRFGVKIVKITELFALFCQF